MKKGRGLWMLSLAAAMLLGAQPALAADEPSAWAANPVYSLQAKQILRADCFGRWDAPISRGELAYLSVRTYEILSGNSLADKNVSLRGLFTDTDDEYVRKAFYAGIVRGYGGGTFGVWDGVSREQAAALLVNAAERAGNALAPVEEPFADQSQVSPWALTAVQKAAGAGFLRGTGGGTISPQSGVTREEALVMVNALLAQPALYAENHTAPLDPPALKWAYGGTAEAACPPAYYSSPQIYDLNGDGSPEIIAGSSSVFSLDAKSGRMNFRVNAFDDVTASHTVGGSGRVWTDVAVRDIDGDGSPEIVAGFSRGWLAVYDAQGRFKPGWPHAPAPFGQYENFSSSVRNYKLPEGEYRALKVEDLDGDGKCEIIAGSASDQSDSLWVFEPDGTIRGGWPQLASWQDGATLGINQSLENMQSTAFAWGFFNNTLSVGDLNGDGKPEIIAPSDVPFVCVYDSYGMLQPATNPKYRGRMWGKVGFWVTPEMDDANDNEGWGLWPFKKYKKEDMMTVNFAHASSQIVDLDGNGKNELVLTGNVYDTSRGHPPILYTGLFIMNADRSRWFNVKYDWTEIPQETLGRPLNDNYEAIETCVSDLVIEDIDGDEKPEILFPSADGKLHCFWLDKTEKGGFPFSVYDGTTEEYASKPALADLDGDGRQEIIFTTWTRKDSGKDGVLYILNSSGDVVQKTALPFALGSADTNGCLAAPKVEDTDGDGKYEIILNTVYSGVVVYDTSAGVQ